MSYLPNKCLLFRLRSVLPLLAIATLFPITNVHAYLDPGSGSYMLQVAIGTVLGASYAVGHFWKNIVGYVKGKFSSKKHE